MEIINIVNYMIFMKGENSGDHCDVHGVRYKYTANEIIPRINN